MSVQITDYFRPQKEPIGTPSHSNVAVLRTALLSPILTMVEIRQRKYFGIQFQKIYDPFSSCLPVKYVVLT